jgi:uncharacterized protein
LPQPPLTTAKPVLTEKLRIPAARTPAWKRRLATLSRWLHVYLSMISFGILLFFAVTGLTLNHAEWFGGKPQTVLQKGAVDEKWVKPKEVARLEIVEYLRRTHGIKGAVGDFRIDDAQLAISFRGPGYTADANIDRQTGKYDLTETRMGFAAVMNDLHKGRDSGPGWSWMIDLSAVLMTLVSLSGLALIFFLPKRRFSGLIVATVGAAFCYAAYRIWVP